METMSVFSGVVIAGSAGGTDGSDVVVEVGGAEVVAVSGEGGTAGSFLDRQAMIFPEASVVNSPTDFQNASVFAGTEKMHQLRSPLKEARIMYVAITGARIPSLRLAEG
jgi:hypothetical protein